MLIFVLNAQINKMARQVKRTSLLPTAITGNYTAGVSINSNPNMVTLTFEIFDTQDEVEKVARELQEIYTKQMQQNTYEGLTEDIVQTKFFGKLLNRERWVIKTLNFRSNRMGGLGNDCEAIIRM